MQKNLLILLVILLWAIKTKAQTPVSTAYTHSSTANGTLSYLYTNLGGTATNRYLFGFNSRPGELNDFWVDSFSVSGGNTYSYRVVPGFEVKLRRVNNASVTGVKNLIYADGSVTSGSSPDTVNIYCTYDTDMETLYSNNKGLTTGTDNIFNNATGNNNNIERIDMIIPSGIAATQGQGPGFAIFERGNSGAHDPVKAALILALDSAGNPSQYSNIVSVTSVNYGTGTLLAGTRNYVILSQQLPADTALKYSTQVGNQSIGGTFLLFTDFGVADTTQVFGYSLIPNDFPSSGTAANLVDYTNATYFPTNTTETNGGIDLIAISGIVANVLMTQPLPLTFISFTLSQKEEGKVLLAWEITDNENLEKIDIQRSADGKIWNSIGSMVPNSKNKYAFTDEAPLTGKNYYRLDFVRSNGEPKYSPVRTIEIAPNPTIKVMPNPVTDYLSISLGIPLDNEGTLQLFNELGQEVIYIKEPNKQLINIDLRGFHPGYYYLVLKNGKKVYYTHQLLKL